MYSHNTITIYYLIVKFYMFYKVYKFHFTFLHMDDVWSLNNSKFDDRDHIGDRILKKNDTKDRSASDINVHL